MGSERAGGGGAGGCWRQLAVETSRRGFGLVHILVVRIARVSAQRAGSDEMGGELAPLNKSLNLQAGSSLLTGRAREAALVDENRQLVLENQGLRSVLVATQVRSK